MNRFYELMKGYARVFASAKDIKSLIKGIVIKFEDEIFVTKLGLKRGIGNKKWNIANYKVSFYIDNDILQHYNEIFALHAYDSVDGFTPKSGDIIVDCGANQGVYTMYAARNVENGRVIAIEPDPDNFFWLEKHLDVNGMKNVHIINKCVGHHEGNVLFRKGERSGTGYVDDMSDPEVNKNERKYVTKLEVGMTTLDKIFDEYHIDHVDILKIDVEGYETEVLNGAKNILGSVSRIVIECHSPKLKQQCTDILLNCGFQRQMHKHPLLDNVAYFYKNNKS